MIAARRYPTAFALTRKSEGASPVSDESLFREVDEEVRSDEFKRLWQRYGNYITAVALGIVIAVAGFKLA